jgi:hypothetical protein
MKQITILLLAFLMVTAGSEALAARTDRPDVEMSGSLAFATGPDVFDDGYGLNFGAGYMMKDISPDLQGRVDISYFLFDRDVPTGNVDFTRIPVAVGGRYFFPAGENMNLFGEAALEVSFDDAEYVDVLGVKHSETDTNWGVTPGIGAEYFINSNTSLFALGRYHVITDDYFSAHFGAAFHF